VGARTIEAGFECVCTHEKLVLFRKQKQEARYISVYFNESL